MVSEFPEWITEESVHILDVFTLKLGVSVTIYTSESMPNACPQSSSTVGGEES